MNVVCVGDCGIDHYLPSGRQCVGGITANFARHARRQFRENDEVHIVSCVGDDISADLVLSSLGKTNIDCHISKLPGRTPKQTIEIEPDGKKTFVSYDEGILRDFHFDVGQHEVIAASSLIVAPVYLQIVDLYDELLDIRTSGLTAIDFADFSQYPDFALLEEHIDRIDIGFFGLSADHSHTIDRIAALAKEYNKLFVVTLGAEGSRAFLGPMAIDCAAMPVERVVDTTGAGDAYAAGFLSRYCHGADVESSMQHGAMLAAIVVANLGN